IQLYPADQNKPGELVANKRYFGEFRCHKCHRHWYSAACWLGFKQRCNGCDQWSDPSNMVSEMILRISHSRLESAGAVAASNGGRDVPIGAL
ncbi:unnamed protein product, partial [Medioppia subpectinata]